MEIELTPFQCQSSLLLIILFCALIWIYFFYLVIFNSNSMLKLPILKPGSALVKFILKYFVLFVVLKMAVLD